MNTHFDAVVVGAGQAGPSLAARLRGAGMTVAIVERHLFGGTCVNTGCRPTKALVASAHAAHMAREAARWGVVVDGSVSMDMVRVRERKDAVILPSRNGGQTWLKDLGCAIYHEHASFLSPTELSLGDEIISAERIFLNVGGRAVVPDWPGADDVPLFTNSSLIEYDGIPEHFVVIGGSYVGLEFAQIYRRFGSQVTVVHRGPRLVEREDPDASAIIQEVLEREGITFRLNASCINLARHDEGVTVGVDCTHGTPEVVGSHVLVAVGRRPNTDDLGLENAGVATDARGYITVDDQLRTSTPGIWALGDCNGRGAFTHTSYNDFEIVAANLLDDDPRRVTDRLPCYALYTDPPLGRVGMTEAQARASGRSVLVGRKPMSHVGRALEKGETDGYMQVLVDADSDLILGATILGVGGDEVVHCLLDTMQYGIPARQLQRTVHIHPTVAEFLPTILGELQPLI
ncbi:FAD-containing oxidoreductase [Mycobacteroides abscessus]|uniref:FAD-containing oxidoreductase n=1 Tax=Mycobacteroides abscessus TaxID=36809 RepID=UPI002103E722|nr:FAD-containing oxidoreductase [Mycobacteroides abscessus]